MGSRYERARICQKTFAVHARIAEFHVPNGPGRPAAQRLPRSANSATRHSAASDMHGERYLTFRAVLATQTPPRASAMVSQSIGEAGSSGRMRRPPVPGNGDGTAATNRGLRDLCGCRDAGMSREAGCEQDSMRANMSRLWVMLTRRGYGCSKKVEFPVCSK